MDMNNIVQIFKTVVDDFNLVEGQNRGIHLAYHIFSGVVDSVVYELEITILATQEKFLFLATFYRKMIQNPNFLECLRYWMSLSN